MTGCSNRADVTAAGGTCDVGGLAGKLEGELHQCFNSGRITTEQGSAGGIVGFLSVSQRIYWQAKSFDSETMDCLSDAYNTGDVSGTKAGGIIGYVFYPHEVDRSVGQHAYVSRVYNTGSIRMEVGEDSEPASGGLIGVLWIDQSRGSRPDTKPFYFHLTSAYSLGLSVTSDKEDADSLLGKIRGGGAANVILSGYRWEGLAVTAGGKSVNVLQGTALNMAEIKSYLSNFYLWPVNHWKTQSGKLPILINAAGAQSGDYPLYLALADGGNQSIGIGSSEELKYAAANWPINTPNLHLYLENDIDMAGITGYAPFQGFAGTFDGKGHAIRNLTIRAKHELRRTVRRAEQNGDC